jgi:hypothetical protein
MELMGWPIGLPTNDTVKPLFGDPYNGRFNFARLSGFTNKLKDTVHAIYSCSLSQSSDIASPITEISPINQSVTSKSSHVYPNF